MTLAATFALLTALAGQPAEPPPPPPPDPPPLPPPALLVGRVVKEKFVYAEAVHVPFMRIVQSPQPGAPATELVYLIKSQQVAVPLKGVKATDTAGKPIPAGKLAEALKDEAVVVVTYGSEVDEKYRKPFKAGTVFLAFPQAPAKEVVQPKEPVP